MINEDQSMIDDSTKDVNRLWIGDIEEAQIEAKKALHQMIDRVTIKKIEIQNEFRPGRRYVFIEVVERSLMKCLSFNDLVQEYAAMAKKPCVFVSWSGMEDQPWKEPWKEIIKAAPFLDEDFVLHHDKGVIVCDSEEEMERIFNSTVGDGPTELNPYKGPGNVYALTCNAKGEWENENT